MLLNGKTAYSGGGLISDVKPEHRLSPSNPTFRANLLVAEGAQSSTAILNQGTGVLIQDLPFSIELKKFVVEHYSTGMPKLFASDIVIHDKETGAKTPARVEVNHPVNYKGIVCVSMCACTRVCVCTCVCVSMSMSMSMSVYVHVCVGYSL